jgi:hypothetical protein
MVNASEFNAMVDQLDKAMDEFEEYRRRHDPDVIAAELRRRALHAIVALTMIPVLPAVAVLVYRWQAH